MCASHSHVVTRRYVGQGVPAASSCAVEYDETDETKVCYAVCRCIKARLCDSNESYITISEDGTFILNKSIFSKKNDHDMYLNEIEEKIDIRCTYEDISSYTNRCMIEKEEL